MQNYQNDRDNQTLLIEQNTLIQGNINVARMQSTSDNGRTLHR